VCLSNTIVLSGYIFEFDQFKSNKDATAVLGENGSSGDGSSVVSLSHEDVYSSLEQFGCNVGEVFKTIKHVEIYEDSMGKINIIFYIITKNHSTKP